MSTYKFWLGEDAELTKHELDDEPDVTVEAEDRDQALDEAVTRLRDTYCVAEPGSSRDTLLCQEGDNWYLITLTPPARSFEVFTRVLWTYEATKFFKGAPVKYTKKQIQEAIFLLEVEANSDISDQDADRDTANCELAIEAYEVVERFYRFNGYNDYWRAHLAEAAALLRDGWLPGDELVDLHTGEVLR